MPSLLRSFNCALYSSGAFFLMCFLRYASTLSLKFFGGIALQSGHSILVLKNCLKHSRQKECSHGRVVGSTMVQRQMEHSASIVLCSFYGRTAYEAAALANSPEGSSCFGVNYAAASYADWFASVPSTLLSSKVCSSIFSMFIRS